MNINGILFGVLALVAIGLGIVWVIKLEYYVGASAARAVAALGITITLASLFVPDFKLSAMMGILGSTIIWGATELPTQARRVAKGMFPANPHRQDDAGGKEAGKS